MNAPDSATTMGLRRWRARALTVLAVLTCPCHVPILAVVLSGTAAGAFLSENLVVAVLAFSLLFALFVWAALRAFRARD
jgi:mercuric ion transport protein